MQLGAATGALVEAAGVEAVEPWVWGLGFRVWGLGFRV